MSSLSAACPSASSASVSYTTCVRLSPMYRNGSNRAGRCINCDRSQRCFGRSRTTASRTRRPGASSVGVDSGEPGLPGERSRVTASTCAERALGARCLERSASAAAPRPSDQLRRRRHRTVPNHSEACKYIDRCLRDIRPPLRPTTRPTRAAARPFDVNDRAEMERPSVLAAGTDALKHHRPSPSPARGHATTWQRTGLAHPGSGERGGAGRRCAPHLTACQLWNAPVRCVGGTSPHRTGTGAAVDLRQAVQPGCGLAAAHLQSPVSIMHAWTTSFPW
jgi:hypothetical protein